ncbi:MAG: PhzF family phenazine biosynthesis protein [Nocardioides sp.]
MLRFTQVDVFTSEPQRGNPVAVVHDADGLTHEEMARFARWTNLSETTFLLAPTDDAADYRLRIFTPAEELPFAGHPTIGSAHAWLGAGGRPRRAGHLVQECGAGLVRLRRAPRLAFAAPPLLRSGAASPAEWAVVAAALAVPVDVLVDVAWVDNGPGWIAAVLPDATMVLGLTPDWSAFRGLEIGVLGAYPAAEVAAGGPLVEVRAFCPSLGVVEDPVTGSLNAGLAQWLIGTGRLPASYVASQGTCLGRAGRVHVDRVGEDVWVGGDAITCVRGEVLI